MRTRPPAVAGRFYPADPEALARDVRAHLATAAPADPATGSPKALIVPHAGYLYSGPIAGSAYRALAARPQRIERVVLLGPSHRVALRGLAAPDADAFASPLGDVPIDRACLAELLALPQVCVLDSAHAAEHSLEVQLPFLQCALGAFRLVPLSVGDAEPEAVAEVLERAWGGPETLIVVSSDLSHYHDYATARRLDAQTSAAIEALDPSGVGPQAACGRVPVRGLLLAARRARLRARTLDLRSSGDTAGSRERVVGYGAYVFS
jgi:AmmeMemoRadiSam system protein B